MDASASRPILELCQQYVTKFMSSLRWRKIIDLIAKEKCVLRRLVNLLQSQVGFGSIENWSTTSHSMPKLRGLFNFM